jgi:hypothetical protein
VISSAAVRVAVLLLVPAVLAAGCAGPRVAAVPALPAGRDEGTARETLRRFARDLEDRRFADAYALLSARWRAAYTPGLLAADWDASGPVGREEAERVLALVDAGAPLVARGEALALGVGAGREARLVPDAGGWRVDALE